MVTVGVGDFHKDVLFHILYAHEAQSTPYCGFSEHIGEDTFHFLDRFALRLLVRQTRHSSNDSFRADVFSVACFSLALNLAVSVQVSSRDIVVACGVHPWHSLSCRTLQHHAPVASFLVDFVVQRLPTVLEPVTKFPFEVVLPQNHLILR